MQEYPGIEMEERGGDLLLRGVRDLDLRQTLDGGQAFRFSEQPDGSFAGVARRRKLRVRLDGDVLTVFDAPLSDAAVWLDYFDLARDYGAIARALSAAHPSLAAACERARGVRVLRQDGWEALCTFILSQNNNIPRIKGLVARLCECFGGELAPDTYDFPSPQRLAACAQEDLAPVRAGFRAAYVLDAARRVASGEIDLDALRVMPYGDAAGTLRRIKGVGPKVADCALLYGFGRMEAFPRDVWINRAVATLFGEAGLPDCARESAGIAQQFLFAYARAEKIGVEARAKKDA